MELIILILSIFFTGVVIALCWILRQSKKIWRRGWGYRPPTAGKERSFAMRAFRRAAEHAKTHIRSEAAVAAIAALIALIEKREGPKETVVTAPGLPLALPPSPTAATEPAPGATPKPRSIEVFQQLQEFMRTHWGDLSSQLKWELGVALAIVLGSLLWETLYEHKHHQASALQETVPTIPETPPTEEHPKERKVWEKTLMLVIVGGICLIAYWVHGLPPEVAAPIISKALIGLGLIIVLVVGLHHRPSSHSGHGHTHGHDQTAEGRRKLAWKWAFVLIILCSLGCVWVVYASNAKLAVTLEATRKSECAQQALLVLPPTITKRLVLKANGRFSLWQDADIPEGYCATTDTPENPNGKIHFQGQKCDGKILGKDDINTDNKDEVFGDDVVALRGRNLDSTKDVVVTITLRRCRKSCHL